MNNHFRQGDYDFIGVCLLAILRKNYLTDFSEELRLRYRNTATINMAAVHYLQFSTFVTLVKHLVFVFDSASYLQIWR